MSKSDDSTSDSNHTGEDVYAHEVERQWGEASSIRGVDPALLDESAHPDTTYREPAPESAAFSPWLIPFAAILTGPMVAAVLALFADGDPPSMRHFTAIISTGLTAWLINVGMASTTIRGISHGAESALRFGVLVGAGIALWALYTYWMKGRQGLGRPALIRSAILLFVLSAIFWYGHTTAPDWWAWMGR